MYRPASWTLCFSLLLLVSLCREGAPIGDYLYAVALDIASRKEAQVEAEREADREAANLRHSTSES
jgi:hypothetical protein